jgi:hypothetical protein
MTTSAPVTTIVAKESSMDHQRQIRLLLRRLFKDSPCAKCGGVDGPCEDNGCFGRNGQCTRGMYEGCSCK